MTESRAPRLERRRPLAEALQRIVHRGVIQHFFLSPLLPVRPLTSAEIAAEWRQVADDLHSGRVPELLSLYLHIPFCPRLCKYCIYYREASRDPSRLETYLDRLHREIDYYAPIFKGLRFTTLTMGGGTPTVLDERQLQDLLEHLGSAFARKPGGEWSFETSPYTFNEAKAKLFFEHGFNRASFGVQTFSRKVLEGVNRSLQSADQVFETIRALQKYRFFINIDLIHGLPGGGVEETLESVRTLAKLGPTHITLYALSPFTPRLDGPGDPTPLPQLAERLTPLVKPYGYRVNSLFTGLSIIRLPELENLLYTEQAKAEKGYAYDDVTINPQSLLALGPTGRSYLFGHLSYKTRAYPVTAPFDPEEPVADGSRLTMEDEKQRYVIYHLSYLDRLDAAEYRSRFGETLEQTFGAAFQELLERKRLKAVAGGYRHAGEDRAERFLTELAFIDDEKIEMAWRDLYTNPMFQAGEAVQLSPRAEPFAARYLRLHYGETALRIGLFEFKEGRPFYHRAGAFAFFIVSEGEQEQTAVPLPVQLAVKAFTRLFDLAVERDEPAGLDALKETLLARGARTRHASFRLAPDGETPP